MTTTGIIMTLWLRKYLIEGFSLKPANLHSFKYIRTKTSITLKDGYVFHMIIMFCTKDSEVDLLLNFSILFEFLN
jgi:hypothetical protein